MDRAYRTEAVVDQEGTVRLHDLPFDPGESVEVIVLTRARGLGPDLAPLRGSVRRYDDPTEPVAADEWDLSG